MFYFGLCTILFRNKKIQSTAHRQNTINSRPSNSQPTLMLRNHLKLHFIVFIWGFTGVLGALITMTSESLVWYRMLIATAGIAAYLWWRRTSFSIPWPDMKNFLLTGLLVAVHWIFFFEAIKVSTVSVALVCFASTSLFAALLEPFFFKRRIIGYEILFGMVAVVGLYLIFEFETKYKMGILFSLFSAFIGALFTVFNGKFMAKNEKSALSGAGIITLFEMAGGFIGLSVYMLATKPEFLFTDIPSLSDWIYLLLLGLVCTAYAFVASVDLLKHISPYTMSISVNLEPVYAIILALIIFGEKEKMTPGFYGGAVVVLITVLGNAIVKGRATRPLNSHLGGSLQ